MLTFAYSSTLTSPDLEGNSVLRSVKRWGQSSTFGPVRIGDGSSKTVSLMRSWLACVSRLWRAGDTISRHRQDRILNPRDSLSAKFHPLELMSFLTSTIPQHQFSDQHLFSVCTTHEYKGSINVYSVGNTKFFALCQRTRAHTIQRQHAYAPTVVYNPPTSATLQRSCCTRAVTTPSHWLRTLPLGDVSLRLGERSQWLAVYCWCWSTGPQNGTSASSVPLKSCWCSGEIMVGGGLSYSGRTLADLFTSLFTSASHDRINPFSLYY